MAFSGRTNEMVAVGSGVIIDDVVSSTYKTFEDGLLVGRFAKLDTGSIDKLDASATPVLAGVVVRNVAGAIEYNGVISTEYNNQVDVLEKGMITVDVKSGVTPAKFDAVYVINLATADSGITTNVSTNNLAVNAYFYEEVKTGVWKIVLNQIAGA